MRLRHSQENGGWRLLTRWRCDPRQGRDLQLNALSAYLEYGSSLDSCFCGNTGETEDFAGPKSLMTDLPSIVARSSTSTLLYHAAYYTNL